MFALAHAAAARRMLSRPNASSRPPLQRGHPLRQAIAQTQGRLAPPRMGKRPMGQLPAPSHLRGTPSPGADRTLRPEPDFLRSHDSKQERSPVPPSAAEAASRSPTSSGTSSSMKTSRSPLQGGTRLATTRRAVLHRKLRRRTACTSLSCRTRPADSCCPPCPQSKASPTEVRLRACNISS